MWRFLKLLLVTLLLSCTPVTHKDPITPVVQQCSAPTGHYRMVVEGAMPPLDQPRTRELLCPLDIFIKYRDSSTVMSPKKNDPLLRCGNHAISLGGIRALITTTEKGLTGVAVIVVPVLKCLAYYKLTFVREGDINGSPKK